MVDVEIDMKEVMKNLTKLSTKVRKSIVNGSLKAGAKIVLDEAKRLVPVRSGNLKESLAIKKKRTKDKKITAFAIAPITKKKTKRYKLENGKTWTITGIVADGYYGHFVEYGHTIKNKKGKKILGNVAPKPYLRPAYESKGKESIKAVTKYFKTRLEKELKKL